MRSGSPGCTDPDARECVGPFGWKDPCSPDGGQSPFVGGHFQGRVNIGEALIRIEAGGCVAHPGGERGVLPRRSFQRPADREIHLRAAVRVNRAVVADQADLQRTAGDVKQLRAKRGVVDVVDILARRDVSDHSVAAGGDGGNARGNQIVDEPAGQSCLCLVVAQVARRDFGIDFPLEGRSLADDIDGAGGRILPE